MGKKCIFIQNQPNETTFIAIMFYEPFLYRAEFITKINEKDNKNISSFIPLQDIYMIDNVV